MMMMMMMLMIPVSLSPGVRVDSTLPPLHFLDNDNYNNNIDDDYHIIMAMIIP